VKIERFEEIIAWQKAKELAIAIYSRFKTNKDYGFRDQIQRASVSIMNNIAEGFESKSNTEFRQFLYISKGSCGEVRSMLYLAKDLKYLSDSDFQNLLNKAIEISKTISGLIKTL